MSTLNKVAGALSSFAHLTALGKAKADDDKDKEKDDRDHEDGDVKKSKAEDKKGDEYAEDDDDMKASGDDQPDSDDGDKDDDGDKKGKKAKAEDDDDKDEEMRGNSAAASARRREQARCAFIFSSPMAARNPVLAANLAFKTRMTRKEALAVLEGTPAPAAQTNSTRASKNPNVGAGSSPSMTSQQAISGNWDAAFKKVRGR